MKRWLLMPLLACAILAPGAAFAASLTYKGLSLTPAIEQLGLSPGQSSLSYQIRLDNNQSFPMTLTASSLDFKSLNNTGGIAFVGSNASQLEHKYGLADWISLPSGQITLPPGGGQFIKVTINNRSDLSPGGHYAAILFKLTPASAEGTNPVQAYQIISSLVFIRKSGGIIYSLDLKQAKLHRRFGPFGWPSSIDTLFYNNGNVQTAPYGLVALNGQHGQLNIDSAMVLPGSSRVMTTNLTNTPAPFWPGNYNVAITYHADDGGTAKIYKTHFFYVGWPFLALVAAIFATIIYALPRWRKKTGKGLVYLFRGVGLLTRKLFKVAWAGLVYVDYLLGALMLKWDKRKKSKR